MENEHYEEGAFLCPMCIAGGRVPFVDDEEGSIISENDEMFQVQEYGPLKVGALRRGSTTLEIWPNIDKFTVMHHSHGSTTVKHLSITRELDVGSPWQGASTLQAVM